MVIKKKDIFLGNLKKPDNISIYDHVIFISSYQYIIDMNASMKFLHSVIILFMLFAIKVLFVNKHVKLKFLIM